MKREIKFRGWRRKYQCWEYGYLIECPAPELNEIVEVNKSGGRIIAAVERDSIGQYTGLHDKNGREIYEGDVVDIGLKGQDGKLVLSPVIYGEHIAGYVLDNGGKGIWQRLTEDCKVIGNVFENPEILEARHD
ncbi:YopX family protein [Schleiferilactobacillus harbinensis]|uniref:YopX family protein n=1 Tax=Schleiferilactobacillus harbinensis TaxID=304207 RepID=UPI0039E86A70